MPLVLVTNPAFPATNVKELVATAKAKPKAVNYASGGSGVTNHLVMEMFRGAAGIDMTHIPYKGGPPALTDLIGGQVNVMFETSVAVLPFVKQGKLRALAVSSSKRISAAPTFRPSQSWATRASAACPGWRSWRPRIRRHRSSRSSTAK